MVKTSSREIILKSMQVAILPDFVPTTGTAIIPVAVLKDCVLLATSVLNNLDSADGADNYFIDNGAIAAGCSVDQFLGIIATFKGDVLLLTLQGNLNVDILTIQTDAILNFDLSQPFVPTRLYINYMQYK